MEEVAGSIPVIRSKLMHILELSARPMKLVVMPSPPDNLLGLAPESLAGFSENTILWVLVFYLDLCSTDRKNKSSRTAEERKAAALASGQSRHYSISRGMPDLDLRLDQKLWRRAFEIHTRRHDFSADALGFTRYWESTIAPTWGDRTSGSAQEPCNCFQVAYFEYLHNHMVDVFGELYIRLTDRNGDGYYREPRE